MSKIDTAPPVEALGLMRDAAGDAREVFARHGGEVAFDDIAAEMATKGWDNYDTRVALSVLRATVNDAAKMYIQSSPYDI